MKLSVALLGLLVALCHAQMPPVRDLYQPVTYNVLTPGTESICATFTLAGQFIVPYLRLENGTGPVLYNVQINLPVLPGNATSTPGSVEGQCPMKIGNDTWFSQLHAEFSANTQFIMNVTATGTDGVPSSWMVTSIEFVYDQTDTYYFPDNYNATNSAVKNVQADPDTINIRSSGDALYRCNAQSTLQLPPTESYPQIEFHYKDLLLNPLNTTVVDPPVSECDADKSSSTDKTVPIAVGSALAGLLVLVLIAYLVGRRMRKSAGYQKV